MTYDNLQLAIHAVEARIESCSTELRCALEELRDLVYKLDNDEKYYTPQGRVFTYDKIQDFANEVNDIEEEFNTEE